ncbi:MAG: hypothetical protein AAF358_01875 [Pseudomonadota bacterium]
MGSAGPPNHLACLTTGKLVQVANVPAHPAAGADHPANIIPIAEAQLARHASAVRELGIVET